MRRLGTFWGVDWAQLVRLPFPPAGMDTELLTDTLRSLSREEPPLHQQVGQARGLPPPLQRPTPPDPCPLATLPETPAPSPTHLSEPRGRLWPLCSPLCFGGDEGRWLIGGSLPG